MENDRKFNPDPANAKEALALADEFFKAAKGKPISIVKKALDTVRDEIYRITEPDSNGMCGMMVAAKPMKATAKLAKGLAEARKEKAKPKK